MANSVKDRDRLKELMLVALKESLGVVGPACEASGVGRTTHYHWLNDDKEYRKAAEECKELAIDFAESALHKQIKGGGVPSTIFYLKTIGKDRGYVERQELDVDGGLSLEVQFIE